MGWLKDVGVKLDLQVIDAGTLTDYSRTTRATPTRPTGTCSSRTGPRTSTRNFIVDIYTPQQIEGWNDCLWTDPEYTTLNEQQITTIDEAPRIPIVQQMQQIFYDGAAYAMLCLPVPARGVQHRRLAGLGALPRRRAR